MTYLLTVGLEVHAELHTKSKMFCGSKNDPDETRPNVNICPVCMAHPGTLPVINRQAVEHVLRMGVAVGGTLADFTEFDRKNYFYPDIPKGYQISQYKYPLVKGGKLAGVDITRIHLEEDTARTIHKDDRSLVDYNRAGVPLMELVTEPVMHDVATVVAFAKELQLLLRALGAGEANMDKGEMRVEANMSVGKDGELGTKVEVKNLNSFRSVERAILYEIDRQTALIEAGGKVVQETRGWDEAGQKTFSQRLKESSHDYRYFPDPDLPKLWLNEVPEWRAENIKKDLPELPWERRARYLALGMKKEDAEMLLSDSILGGLFEDVSKTLDAKQLLLAVNYITSDLAGLGASSGLGKLTSASFAGLISMISSGALSSRGGKDLLTLLYSEGGEPEALAKEKGLLQQSDEGALKKIAEEIIAANASVAADYKAGKESALMFLVGQGMKASKGSANPQTLREIFKTLLS
ncbi:Asp-tRNA(Asn)/Glu-tRNA(Gln) amidotransferase subunit GatB [Candidatus Parcubacteria bacterium]|nr:Asp-tRNA(Asn)/Glu-tRNA(Gln) amidotransferase subunit GatB [Candidatus Parcubacteria bacterium]